mgnify:CR=1 FL=1
MNTQLFDSYAELEKQIRALEEQKDAMRVLLLSEVSKADGGVVATESATFKLRITKSWEYSDGILLSERAFKDEIARIKDLAQKNGEATCKETQSLVVTLKS